MRRRPLGFSWILLMLGLVLLLTADGALALINPKLTPAQVVRTSGTILWGKLAAANTEGRWDFNEIEALKGAVTAKSIRIHLDRCKPGEQAAVKAILDGAGRDGAMLLLSARAGRGGSLHAGGTWLTVAPLEAGQCAILGIDAPMSAVFAGGTDMLTLMARHLLADPEATVPVSAGTAWMAEAIDIGTIKGGVAGMEVIELAGDPPRSLLYVAGSAGDRLYRPRKAEEGFDDATDELALGSRSKQFAWLDPSGKGDLALASWDGESLSIWTIDKRRRFQRENAARPRKKPCLGLAACSVSGTSRPALLVSTDGLPVLLHREGETWKQETLPDGPFLKELGLVACACIVADLDNDGCFDVLQPRAKGGSFWKGSKQGFAGPVRCDVECPDGPGRLALGDFDQDGSLDVFIASRQRNELYENDGRGRFRAVTAGAGSLAYKCPTGLSGCRVADLNHDGRPDLLLLHPQGAFTFHFNRGFRCFGEEGELRLKDGDGQMACAVGDFNHDGSLDLAVALADGRLRCFYNDCFNRPLLRVGLAAGVPGPITVSIWRKSPTSLACMGTAPLAGPLRTHVALRAGRDCTVKWTVPGQPARSRTIRLPEELPGNGVEVLIGPEPAPAASPPGP